MFCMLYTICLFGFVERKHRATDDDTGGNDGERYQSCYFRGGVEGGGCGFNKNISEMIYGLFLQTASETA